jgi:hypothetical protein
MNIPRQDNSYSVNDALEEEPMGEQGDQEEVEQEAEPEESPTREANGDDLADLFAPPKATDPEMQTDDLVSVDLDRDVMGGDLSDLTRVTDEDVMGKPFAPKPRKPHIKPNRRVVRTARRYNVPPSVGGIQY